jgi:hypothetical protein
VRHTGGATSGCHLEAGALAGSGLWVALALHGRSPSASREGRGLRRSVWGFTNAGGVGGPRGDGRKGLRASGMRVQTV